MRFLVRSRGDTVALAVGTPSKGRDIAFKLCIASKLSCVKPSAAVTATGSAASITRFAAALTCAFGSSSNFKIGPNGIRSAIAASSFTTLILTSDDRLEDITV
jgi:hypothetical protein